MITELVREWDYGDYEGLKSHEITAKHPGWAIWKDGLVGLCPAHSCVWYLWIDFSPFSCPNGESVEEMTARVDCVVGDVRSRYICVDGVKFVSPRFVNIIGNGRRKVRGREML